jgi:hypothetical protein
MVPFFILVSSGGESLCELVPNEVREALPGEPFRREEGSIKNDIVLFSFNPSLGVTLLFLDH